MIEAGLFQQGSLTGFGIVKHYQKRVATIGPCQLKLLELEEGNFVCGNFKTGCNVKHTDDELRDHSAKYCYFRDDYEQASKLFKTSQHYETDYVVIENFYPEEVTGTCNRIQGHWNVLNCRCQRCDNVKSDITELNATCTCERPRD